MGRVLIATDGSELALAAAGHAVRLLGASHDYCLLAVVAAPADLVAPGAADMAAVGGVGAGGLGAAAVYGPEVLARQAEALAEEARGVLERTAAVLPDDLHLERRVEHGDPGTVICRVADDDDVDVIAVGSHGAGFVRRLLLGSVSNHVLNQAPCPVLVLRERDHGGAAGTAAGEPRSSE